MSLACVSIVVLELTVVAVVIQMIIPGQILQLLLHLVLSMMACHNYSSGRSSHWTDIVVPDGLAIATNGFPIQMSG